MIIRRFFIQMVKRKLFFCVTIICILFSTTSFLLFQDISRIAIETQSILNLLYDSSREVSALKKLDLKLTEDGFLRCRKTFASGKIEYHSLNITRLNEISYLGDELHGNLILQTIKEDIIVQTYNDKKGDVDSMTSVFSIPFKNVTAEDLDLLQHNFLEIKKELDVH